MRKPSSFYHDIFLISNLQWVLEKKKVPLLNWTLNELASVCSPSSKRLISSQKLNSSLGWEEPLEKGMATHFSILSWRIPWAEEPGWLTDHGIAKSQTRMSNNTHIYPLISHFTAFESDIYNVYIIYCYYVPGINFIFILLFNPDTSSLELKLGFDHIIPLKLPLLWSPISSTLLNTIININSSIYLT